MRNKIIYFIFILVVLVPNRLDFVQTHPVQELDNKSPENISQPPSEAKEPNIILKEPLFKVNLLLKNYDKFANRPKRFVSAGFMNMGIYMGMYLGDDFKPFPVHEALASKRAKQMLGTMIGGAIAGGTGGPIGIALGAAGGAVGYGISDMASK
ncbi:uncharacterized protein LOC113378285 [Ctenocephalides felis]|uniref:uncharacterized protein LOC113378285 n=1 Tax=Ctenocephalides felis TaxID=7515 RepID=UPI000E6E5506|nr:uncharacterized protein LOC113378285 [Ctenocephalides felis]